MDKGRLERASWRDAGHSIRAHLSRALTGVGLAAAPSWASAAERKESRHDDKQADDEGKRRDGGDDRDNRQNAGENGDKSDKNEEKNETGAESQDTDDSRDKRDRRDDRAADDESNDVDAESNDKEDRRADRRQEADSDDGNGGSSGREPVELAQNRDRDRNRDDEPADQADDPVTAPVAPSNPNVPADTVSNVLDPSDAELAVQGNEDVIASVSTEGGFAFARSGNVIAISGPDGAQIIQSDDPDAVVTPSPEPDEPSDDGGNNDVDFTS